jgi:hypothetical protein
MMSSLADCSRVSSNIRNARTFFSTHRAKFEANAPVRMLVEQVK